VVGSVLDCTPMLVKTFTSWIVGDTSWIVGERQS